MNQLIKSDKFQVTIWLSAVSEFPFIPILALVDSGSDANFIDEQVVSENKLPRIRKSKPIELIGINGIPLSTKLVEEETILSIACETSDSTYHLETPCHFGIIHSPDYPVILGLSWLRTHQPLIDWKARTLTFNSDFCSEHCRSTNQLPTFPCLLPEQTCHSNSIPPVTDLNRSAIPEQTLKSDSIPPVTDHINLEIGNPAILPAGTITLPDMHPDISIPRELSLWEHMVIANIDSSAMEREFVEDDWNIDLEEDTLNDNVTTELPPKFAEFSDVFDPKNADELPPHRPYDCEIELLPGMSPPFGPIYPLSRDEEKLSLEYLEINTKRKFIRETKSPVGSPVFFVDKPNEVVQPGRFLRNA